MNAAPVAALGKTAQTAAGSFFEALASVASPLPAQSRPAPMAPSIAASQADSENAHAADPQADLKPVGQILAQGTEREVSRQVSGQISGQSQAPEAASTGSKTNARQTLSQSRATTVQTGASQNMTNQNQQPHLSSTVLAAKIAAAVFLPSLPPLTPAQVTVGRTLPPSPVGVGDAGSGRTGSIGSSATSAPSVSVSFADVPVPPAANANAGEKSRDCSAGVAEISATSVDDHSQVAAHTEARSGQKSPPAVLKTPDLPAEAASESATASENASPSAPADSSSMAVTQSLSVAPRPLAALVLPQAILPSSGQSKAENGDNNGQTVKASDLSNAKSSDSPASDAAAKTSQSQPASTGSTVSAAGNANQAGQHAPSNALPPAPASSRSADSGTAQVQTIAAQSIPRDSAAHALADAPAEASRPSGQPLAQQAGEAVAAPAINTAKLIQSMSQTEMRVGMHSAEFGEISIRTAVSQQQMTAQISVDHGDLASAISTHIPAMQEKLGGETGLKALVEVSQGNMSFSGERGGSSPRQQPGHAAPARVENTDTPGETDHPVSRAATWAAGNGYRLDIRA